MSRPMMLKRLAAAIYEELERRDTTGISFDECIELARRCDCQPPLELRVDEAIRELGHAIQMCPDLNAVHNRGRMYLREVIQG